MKKIIKIRFEKFAKQNQKAYFDKSFLKDREVQEGKKTFLQKSFLSLLQSLIIQKGKLLWLKLNML